MWQAVVANNARRAESQQRQEAFRQRDLAVEREKEAATQRRIAEDQRRVAEHRTRLARSREIAVRAIRQLETDPELSLLLAIEAAATTATFEAEEALRLALVASHLRRVVGKGRQRTEGAAFTPDGRRLATVGTDGLAIWDIASGKLLFDLGGGALSSVLFSDDGRFLVTTGSYGESVRVWNARTRQSVFEVRNSRKAAVSPDSRRLLAMGITTASLWDLATGKLIAELSLPANRLNDAVFSPNSHLVATAGSDNTARIWDAETGTLLHALDHEGQVETVRFSGSGRLLVTTTSTRVRLWAADTGEMLRENIGPGEMVYATGSTPSSDASLLAPNDLLLLARTWSLGEEPRLVLPVTGVVLSPTGEFFASAHGAWDAETGTKLATFHGPPQVQALGTAVSRDGNLVVTTFDDGSARIWAAGLKATTRVMRKRADFRTPRGGVVALDFSPDSTRVGAAFNDGSVAVWNVGQAFPQWERSGHATEPTSFAFSPTKQVVVTAGKQDQARVWDAATGTSLAVLSGRGAVNSVTFSPDGSLIATVGSDRIARLWTSDTFKHRYSLAGHQGGLHCTRFSRDGSLVVTCDDRSARVWNARSGQLVHELRGHAGIVTNASFSPTGRYLVTSTGSPRGDWKARVWEVASGQLVATLSDARNATFGPDDRRLLTVESRFARIRNWKTTDVLHEYPDVQTAQWSADGRFVLTMTSSAVLQL